MSGPKKIEQWEVERYWEIFVSLLPPGTDTTNSNQKHYLSGGQAAEVLKNSRLRDDQLERVWDLADVDNDGQLDFEEFCVAMRLVFDLVNGEYADVPQTLPDWLVPEGKAHLVQASRAIGGGLAGERFERPQDDEDDDDGMGGRLKDNFDWYMAPGQKAQYEEIYNSTRDGHGYVKFSSLHDLYLSLDVPETDVRSAWNLINPSADEVISKDACLAFLHILNQRHEGYRLPRNVPPSLRASFEKRDVDFNIERVRNQSSNRSRFDENTSTGRKAKFGDAYLSRLGGGGGYKPKGTDFSGTKTTEDWEEVRLKKQLRELELKIEKVEAAAKARETKGGRRADSKPALIKRELELMLDYKRRQLRKLQDEEHNPNSGASKGLKGAEEDIDVIQEQVSGLEAHLRTRQEVLEDLKRQVRDEKGR